MLTNIKLSVKMHYKSLYVKPCLAENDKKDTILKETNINESVKLSKKCSGWFVTYHGE